MAAYDQDMKKNDVNGARSVLLQGTRQYPREPLFWNDLAYLAFRDGDYGTASRMLGEGLLVAPGNQRLLLNQARLDLAEGNDLEAKKILFGMLPHHPWIHGYRLLLAIVEVKGGNVEAGRILFEDLRDHHPEDPLIRRYLEKMDRSTISAKSLPNR